MGPPSNLTDTSVHGDVSSAQLLELGLRRQDVVDFAVNVNPYGPPPGLSKALAEVEFSSYPDRQNSSLYAALMAHTGVARDRLCAGNGAAELIWATVRELLSARGTLLAVEPTFSEALAAAKISGKKVSQLWLRQQDGYRPDPRAIGTRLAQQPAELVYLCQPNNPTGAYWQPNAVRELAADFPNVYWLLDEAFLALSKHHAEASVSYPNNVVRIRSLTKDLAIAGLRLAYLIAAPNLTARIAATLPPWNVNVLAQTAGVFGLEHWEHVEQSRSALLSGMPRLASGLAKRGISTLPSSSIFVLAEVGNAAAWRAQLLSHGVIVRDCTSFGLPEHARLCVRPAVDQDRLFAAIDKTR